MGQYYHVVTLKDGVNKYYDIQMKDYADTVKEGNLDYKLYNGLKLMEHSWWNNDFCRAFSETLVDNPTKVAWVGDYAEDDICEKVDVNRESIWKRDDYVHPSVTKFKLDSVKYLINNSKKEFVDLQNYKKNSTNEEGWCIYPISLLTSIGCGLGGGDYHLDNVGSDWVGSWANDEIYLSNELPNDFTEIDLMFME